MSQLSETVHHKDLFHCANLINILVMHLHISAHLVVVMNTEDMGSTHELLTAGRYYQQIPGRCMRLEGWVWGIMGWQQHNNAIRERSAV